jgi:hypothetical protein
LAAWLAVGCLVHILISVQVSLVHAWVSCPDPAAAAVDVAVAAAVAVAVLVVADAVAVVEAAAVVAAAAWRAVAAEVEDLGTSHGELLAVVVVV